MVVAGYVPCSLVDFPGLVSAVVFTQGCNWRCPWCHNKGLIPAVPRLGAPTVGDLMQRLEKRRGKIDGVVLTGGEPTIHPGVDLFFHAVRGLGFLSKLDTNGSNPGALSRLLEAGLLDFVAMDIKAPWHRYAESCGVPADIEALQTSLRLIRESGVSHQLRTTRWPGLGPEDEPRILEIVAGSPHVWQEYRAPATHGV